MILHKVKHLLAAVVFLATPACSWHKSKKPTSSARIIAVDEENPFIRDDPARAGEIIRTEKSPR